MIYTLCVLLLMGIAIWQSSKAQEYKERNETQLKTISILVDEIKLLNFKAEELAEKE